MITYGTNKITFFKQHDFINCIIVKYQIQIAYD